MKLTKYLIIILILLPFFGCNENAHVLGSCWTELEKNGETHIYCTDAKAWHDIGKLYILKERK